MRKRILFILSIGLGFCQLYAQDSLYFSILWKPKPIHREATISQEKVYEYNLVNDVITDSAVLEINFFDTLGQLIKQQGFRNNQQVSELTHFYSGSILDSSLEVQAFPYEVIVQKYRYDSSGKLFLVATKKRQSPVVYDQYVYNTLHQPLYILSKKEQGKEYVSTRYEYGSDNLIKSIRYFEEDEKRRRSGFLYSYDKKKRKTTRLIGFPGGMSMIDCVRTYNGRQQLVKLERPSRGTVLNESDMFRINQWDEEEIYTYHPNGLLKEKVVFKNGKRFKLVKHFYN